mmetsp:Transcript_1118/g.1783  ORF Transcript_1118/g.1783 Transcript_1118/m.1783 type:complete len:325 (+) Transcript_1118:861-1835(+)
MSSIKQIFNLLKSGDRATLEHYISTGQVNPESRDSQGNSLLHLAAELTRNETAIIQLLLSNGWSLNDQNSLGASPLHYVALRKDSGKHVGLLFLEAGADPNLQTSSGHTPLHIAAERLKPELAFILLQHNANPNALDANSNSPVHALMANKARDTVAKEVLEILVNAGASLGFRNNEGNDPLLLAASKGYTKVIQFLFKQRVNPCTLNYTGNTIAHEAAANNHSELLELLLTLEYPFLNSRNKEGNTPLHLAVIGNHYESALVLLKRGASMSAMNTQGKTPVELATQEEKDIFAAKNPGLVHILTQKQKPSKPEPQTENSCLIQ